MRPVIGVTSDCNMGTKGGSQTRFPHLGYCLRPSYINAVNEAGGLPLILPINSDPEGIKQLLTMIQGLVITGGGHDLDPCLYGEERAAFISELNEERTVFELAMAKGALEQGKPVLGICNGLQVINVAAGGTLHQDIPTQIKGSLPHQQEGPRTSTAHEVYILPDSRLRQMMNAEKICVNSLHHQAVKGVGSGFRVNAVATDGVIEGIEKVGPGFAIGVQWHPEDLYQHDPRMKALFAAFIKDCLL